MYKSNFFGFSLLELLVCLAIVGILVALAYPKYTMHIAHVRRTEAEVALAELSTKLEQYYEAQNSYAKATLRELNVNEFVADGFYRLKIDTLTDMSYEISAIPQKSQITADSACGILSLDQANIKKVSGLSSVQACWQ